MIKGNAMMPEEFLQLGQHTISMPPPEAYDAVNELLTEKRKGNLTQLKQSELIQYVMLKCSVTETTAFTWLDRVILGVYNREGWKITKTYFCKNGIKPTEDTWDHSQFGYTSDASDGAKHRAKVCGDE
jgi:hypothetical protein